MTRLVRFSASVLAVAGNIVLCAQGPPPARRTFSPPESYVPTQVTASTSELRDLVDRFGIDRAAIVRFYTLPGSPARRARIGTFYGAWLKTLDAVDFDRLSQEGKVDYVLLRTRIEYEQALVAREDAVQREIAPLVPFANDIVTLVEDRERLDFVGADAAAKAVDAIGAKVQAAQARTASAAGVSPATAVRAAEEVDTLSDALGRWFAFYNGYDPAFTSLVPPRHKTVSEALVAYATTLREKLAGLPPGAGRRAAPGDVPEADRSAAVIRASEGPIVGSPIGRDGLLADLRGEMIVYTPEQLIEIGNREYAWCEREMKKASRELGYGDDWKKALEHVKNIYVPRGEQPALVRDLALQAFAFLRQHDLITIPPLAEDSWRLTMMTPAEMRVNPFFLGGETIHVSYPAAGMSDEDGLMVMRGNGPHLSHATVFHELIPGHALQEFMTPRANPHRALFDTPFMTEGWALYWEFVMWDQGFHRTPEDRIGALFWRMHRCARIVFSLNFHLGRWTPEQAVQYLVDRVGHDRFTAEGEVRRSFNGSYSPLYQAGYMLGALQIRSLMHEAVDSKRMTLKQFNDAVIREGAMPIELLRAALLQQPLARDYRAGWQFYGDVPSATATAASR